MRKKLIKSKKKTVCRVRLYATNEGAIVVRGN